MAEQSSPTHFELFGLPQSFAVDRVQLDTRYRELQRAAHPDRYATASDLERRVSAQQATHINEAYQTLKDPLARGRYLLELAGIRFDDQHRTTRDAAFLMEQMELREALGEVRAAQDVFAALGAIQERIHHDIDALVAELTHLFARGDGDSLQTAGESLMKLQFFHRLQGEAVELEMTLEDELA
jgi:molecular chaperone HscB